MENFFKHPLVVALIGIAIGAWLNDKFNSKRASLPYVVQEPVAFPGDKTKLGIINATVTSNGTKDAENVECVLALKDSTILEVKARPERLHPVESHPKLTLGSGAYPRAVGFDQAAGLVYGQDFQHQLLIFSPAGVKLQELQLGSAASQVQQILVHPAGRKVLVLTTDGLFLVDVPKA
jgi:hypothetical protein